MIAFILSNENGKVKT